MTRDKRCENCRFYHAFHGAAEGDCHRYPPSVPWDAKTGEHGKGDCLTFATTEPEEWCGEWQAKDGEA